MGALLRVAVRRGLLGGSTPWTYVFVVAGLWRLLRRVTRRSEQVVFSDELRPGQQLVITSLPASSIIEP